MKVLPQVQAELTRRGYEVVFSEPDADDPLGGVLTVRSVDADPVQVVNYLNPWKGWAEVGKEAVETAEPNVLELLDRHPPEALESVRSVCERLHLGRQLAAVLASRP
jgi:hypothetical protein